jgi:hypothetical protein
MKRWDRRGERIENEDKQEKQGNSEIVYRYVKRITLPTIGASTSRCEDSTIHSQET